MSKVNPLIQPDGSIDAISVGTRQGDYLLFFGPIEGRPMEGSFRSLSDVLVAAQLAPSKSWCRKNGWDKSLEPGYQEFVFGAKRVRVCVLMPF